MSYKTEKTLYRKERKDCEGEKIVSVVRRTETDQTGETKTRVAIIIECFGIVTLDLLLNDTLLTEALSCIEQKFSGFASLMIISFAEKDGKTTRMDKKATALNITEAQARFDANISLGIIQAMETMFVVGEKRGPKIRINQLLKLIKEGHAMKTFNTKIDDATKATSIEDAWGEIMVGK